MNGFIDTIRAFLLVLPPIIFLHETGHFLAARWCGVRVLRFSLGFGPRLFGFTRGGTDYQLALVPLGGYVKMAGDSPESPDTTGAPDEFLNQVWWKKAIIAAAGPAMNLVLAYFVLVAVYRIGGKSDDYDPILGRVAQGSYASQLGLQAGDQVVRVDGTPINSWNEFTLGLVGRGTEKFKEHHIGYLRSGKTGEVVLPDKRAGEFFGGVGPHNAAIVGSVLLGQPAYIGGLKDGDKIVSINGRAVEQWTDLTDIIYVSAGKPLAFKVERGGRALDLTITPQAQEDGPRAGRIGIAPLVTRTYYSKGEGWPRALQLAWTATQLQVGETYAGFGKLISRPAQFSQQVGGPIMISQLASTQARRGVSDLLWFGAFISVAIMAFNLLPIPILDGGHIAIALAEALMRKPLNMKQLVLLQRIGIGILGPIMIFVLLNDPLRMLQRDRNVSKSEHKALPVPTSP